MTDLEVDNLIEEVINLNEEKARLKDLTEKKIKSLKNKYEELEYDLDNKIKNLEDQISFEINNCNDRKETKTTLKKKFISGEVVITKAHKTIENPNLKGEEARKIEEFKDHIEPETVYNFKWGELKKKLTLTESGKVVNKETGEDFTSVLTVADVPEKISIKPI